MKSEYPKISEYGLIGDCRTAALVSKYGSIEWLCLPHFDSNPFFAAILDRKLGGHFQICPTGEYTSRQYYIEDSNVLVTEFRAPTGKALLKDCFAVTNEENKRRCLWPEHELLRIIEIIEGEIEIYVCFAPEPSFGLRHFTLIKRGALGLAADVGSKLLTLNTTIPPELIEIHRSSPTNEASLKLKMRAGERHTFSMTYSATAPAVIPPVGADSDRRFDLTVKYWRNWISKCQYHGPYETEIRRSALTLKLLLFAPSGAIVAAPTTSLPEEIGGERNWDYRYCWLRDAAFTVRAFVKLGYTEEAFAFASWMLHATRLTHPHLQVLYSVFGHAKIPERHVHFLDGYRGSRPVRIGNAASDQFQLDVYGEVLDALWLTLPHMGKMSSDTKEFIVGLGDITCDLWQEPDDGIWEVRSGRAQHTHSKVLAWVALDRLVKICKHYGWKAPCDRYVKTKEMIRQTIEREGFNSEIGAYTRTLGGHELDASLLALPLVGYCPAHAPRMRSTIEVIKRELAVGELVYRYRSVDDGVSGGEGAFGLCSFWLIECEAKCGNLKSAREMFDAFLRRRNDLHLWPEQIDVQTGEFLGNYPQAFTHVGLINCALTLFEGGLK